MTKGRMTLDEAQRVLGVEAPQDTDAYRETLHTAWRAAAKRNHPDLNKESGASAKFVEAKAAYEKLLRASRGELDDEEKEQQEPDDSEEMDRFMDLVVAAITDLRGVVAVLVDEVDLAQDAVDELHREVQDLRHTTGRAVANIEGRLAQLAEQTKQRLAKIGQPIGVVGAGFSGPRPTPAPTPVPARARAPARTDLRSLDQLLDAVKTATEKKRRRS